MRIALSNHSMGLGESTLHSVQSMETFRSIKSLNSSVRTQAKRFNLYTEVAPKSTVFCQGSAGLKDAVESACKKVDAFFYAGRGGAREDLS